MNRMSARLGADELRRAVDGQTWYHTLEFPHGIETKGFYDLRSVLPKVPIPASLAGKQCLDLASADGFWAFEFARRGAARVVSVDLEDHASLDWQGTNSPSAARSLVMGRTAEGFHLANEALGFKVERFGMSLYEVSNEVLGGPFDFVFMGNVLLHLRDPVSVLRKVLDLTSGIFLSFEAISLTLSVLFPHVPVAQLWEFDEPRWWTPNVRGHRRLLEAGGFEILRGGGPVFQKFGPIVPARPKSLTSPRNLQWWLFVRRFGVASSWLLTQPKKT